MWILKRIYRWKSVSLKSKSPINNRGTRRISKKKNSDLLGDDSSLCKKFWKKNRSIYMKTRRTTTVKPHKKISRQIHKYPTIMTKKKMIERASWLNKKFAFAATVKNRENSNNILLLLVLTHQQKIFI